MVVKKELLVSMTSLQLVTLIHGHMHCTLRTCAAPLSVLSHAIVVIVVWTSERVALVIMSMQAHGVWFELGLAEYFIFLLLRNALWAVERTFVLL